MIWRRDAEELRAIRPTSRAAAPSGASTLVDERRRLQRVMRPLAPQIRGGPLAKLVMDERNQSSRA